MTKLKTLQKKRTTVIGFKNWRTVLSESRVKKVIRTRDQTECYRNRGFKVSLIFYHQKFFQNELLELVNSLKRED